ncbi:MAG: ribonuclease E/G, partial [Planctomycetes bacterium]|nr:ribonuclease E/G [Planctomycetota bacterium]
RTVADRVKREPGPAELYRESDLVIRTIRDVYTTDFNRLLVDDPATAERAREFLQIAMPRTKARVDLYTDREPLFHRFGIELEIEKISTRLVPLPSGGSIVIDTTEAMVAIDVNSGKFRSPENAEETALKINTTDSTFGAGGVAFGGEKPKIDNLKIGYDDTGSRILARTAVGRHGAHLLFAIAITR